MWESSARLVGLHGPSSQSPLGKIQFRQIEGRQFDRFHRVAGSRPGLPADDVGEVLSEFGGDDEGVKGVDDPVVFRTRWNCPVTKPNRTER
jgi:hypothetical protein